MWLLSSWNKRRRQPTPIQTIKLVMFGSGGVGKTSLVHRFLFNKFENNYPATIEDDYRQVITHNNHIVDLTVLDTAGSYQFPAMRRHAIQHGHGFIIVYSVDNHKSLDEAKRLYNEVTCEAGDCPIVLVGNKIDKSPLGKRKITREKVEKILQTTQMNVEFIETSAKTNENVSLVFNTLIGFIDDRNMEELIASAAIITSNSIKNKNRANLSRSTMRLNSASKTSLYNKTNDSPLYLNRSLSIDGHLEEMSGKRNTKKKLIKKFFSRKTLR